MADVIILLFLLLAGMAAHFLKHVIEERKAGHMVTLTSYWVENPYVTAFSIVGAVAGFIILYGYGELTQFSAFGLGYTCDSAAGVLGDRGSKKLKGG